MKIDSRVTPKVNPKQQILETFVRFRQAKDPITRTKARDHLVAALREYGGFGDLLSQSEFQMQNDATEFLSPFLDLLYDGEGPLIENKKLVVGQELRSLGPQENKAASLLLNLNAEVSGVTALEQNFSDILSLQHAEKPLPEDYVFDDAQLVPTHQKTEIKTFGGADEITFTIVRNKVNNTGFKGAEVEFDQSKIDTKVNLDEIAVKNQNGEDEKCQPSAFICHSGSSKEGHYVAYIKETLRDNSFCWVLYDDAARKELKTKDQKPQELAEILTDDVKRNIYAVKYSKPHIANIPQFSGISNNGNYCWLNAALVFAGSYRAFQFRKIEEDLNQSSVIYYYDELSQKNELTPRDLFGALDLSGSALNHSESNIIFEVREISLSSDGANIKQLQEQARQKISKVLVGENNSQVKLKFFRQSFLEDSVKREASNEKEETKFDFSTTNQVVIKNPKEESQKLIITALRTAKEKSGITDEQASKIILIAIENGGIKSSEDKLAKSLKDAFGNSPGEDLVKKAIKFSATFQKEMDQNQVYTGNKFASELVGMRLKRLTKNYAELIKQKTEEIPPTIIALPTVRSIETHEFSTQTEAQVGTRNKTQAQTQTSRSPTKILIC